MMSATNYNPVARSEDETVVAEFVPVTKNATHYQSESQLEQEFIRLLVENNKYEYLKIANESDLLNNLRKQITKLNNIEFTNSEWQRLLNEYLLKKNDDVIEKTGKIQENRLHALEMEDGRTENIKILDERFIHKNSVQVINQYENSGTYENRYDVTILVNGLPLVHIELKRRGVSLTEAFNQIERYKRESFWAGSGLFEYVQLFVISNGTHTKYYSNTVRRQHLKKKNGEKLRGETSNSFEFASWWTDAGNNRIEDLVDFTGTFLTKHVLLSILTKYCVFDVNRRLLVMRPYQIAALEKIIQQITISVNSDRLGSVDAGGYVWHTTGSGKTLTSFKTAQLATDMDEIDKVVFVVDRKDLDHQTMQEYNKFQEESANSTKNTKILSMQLADSESKIIVTTIQKLAKFVNGSRNHDVFNKNVVMIFDECHRSQFGKMHQDITRTFRKYAIFGFTGTPIFDQNASGEKSHLRTTENAFGEKLHSYTIVDAINDENVLPFNVDYVKTMRMKEHVLDAKVQGIDDETIVNAPQRIRAVTDYIISNFKQKTRRDRGRKQQFNSILAVSSIESAKKYYDEFKARNSGLKTATIFSFNPNENTGDLDEDESFDTENLPRSSREFLDSAIADYNRMFGTAFDTGNNFENYYKDVSQKMKDGKLDLLIVVNMFLTGFDAPNLNTLWIDKNLRFHGLLQAFSRTNRILNSIKAYGNIVCFRGLQENIREAISLFGNENAGGIVILKTFEQYYYDGWDENGERKESYQDLIAKLNGDFPLSGAIEGEDNERGFIKLWGSVLRLRNILESFEEFKGREILNEREFQDYQSRYLDLYEKHRKRDKADKENVQDDVEFEVELVGRDIIDIEYILNLVGEFWETGDETKREDIDRAMKSSIELRSKRELVKEFVNSFNGDVDAKEAWKKFTNESKEDELEKIINEEELKPDETRKFIENAFEIKELRDTGTDFPDILQGGMSIFGEQSVEDKKKSQRIFEKLKKFFEKYLNV